MLYVFGNEEGASIVYDENTLTEEDKLRGIPILELPIEDIKQGKVAVLKVDTFTKEVYYDYVDEPLLPVEIPIVIQEPDVVPVPQPTNQEVLYQLEIVKQGMIDIFIAIWEVREV